MGQIWLVNLLAQLRKNKEERGREKENKRTFFHNLLSLMDIWWWSCVLCLLHILPFLSMTMSL
jgi:hypothetical protein